MKYVKFRTTEPHAGKTMRIIRADLFHGMSLYDTDSGTAYVTDCHTGKIMTFPISKADYIAFQQENAL